MKTRRDYRQRSLRDVNLQGGPQAPRIKRKTVPCAECGAKIGQPCMTAAGKPSKGYHQARKRMAVRKYNADRGVTDIELPENL